MVQMTVTMGLMLRVFMSTLMLISAGGGCEVVRDHLYSPKIEVKCEILLNQCRFRNYGDPGEECVALEVFHKESGRVVRSLPVCSGHLERDFPVDVPIQFEGADAVRLCMGEKMNKDFTEHCEVSVVDVVKP